ncbi:hypothetical protein AB0F81_14400 [Actinoplanes sp. NPDC024001]|uniref:hypothetical protein n=1 Tax=Actinoplanes sp. NPDC024001 TaxID=3154598 RepID=UPI0033DB4401
MLASLLPGLRDIRTPLTVGYLWLVILWLVLADDLPRTKPPDGGLVARLFDLSRLVGSATTIAALSFIAYVLGALLTIPTDSRLLVGVVNRLPLPSADFRLTALEYENYLQGGIVRRLRSLSPDERSAAVGRVEQSLANAWSDFSLHRRMRIALERIEFLERTEKGAEAEEFQPRREALIRMDASVADLRARLLVRSPEMYGEYDRLAAEAAFRINLCLPVIALGFVFGFGIGWWWAPAAIAVAALLLVQGTIRLGLSITVMRRAIIEGMVEHPFHSRMQELM